MCVGVCCFFLFQAEDGIRDLVRSRGLGDVYKRQEQRRTMLQAWADMLDEWIRGADAEASRSATTCQTCLLYTSDAADERSSVDLGGRRIIKKTNRLRRTVSTTT